MYELSTEEYVYRYEDSVSKTIEYIGVNDLDNSLCEWGETKCSKIIDDKKIISSAKNPSRVVPTKTKQSASLTDMTDTTYFCTKCSCLGYQGFTHISLFDFFL